MKNSGKIVFSMLMLAGILPVMMWLVIGKDKFTLLSRADENKQIRIWIEPAEVVMAKGQSYTFKIMAESEDHNVLVPRMDLEVGTEAGVNIVNNSVSYPYSFGGKTEIGAIEAKAIKPGKYEVRVDELSVVTGLNDVPILAAPAIVTVR